MNLLLAGGTGLVGNEVLTLCLARTHHVTSVGRRPTGRASREIVSGFSELPLLPTADAAVCTLGTTIRQAGSREAFREVDYAAVLSFAAAARAADIEHFMVVTAVGAQPDASVFYSRVKGELERDLQKMDFSRLDILRPGLLIGPRKGNRPIEAFLQHIAPIADRIMLGAWRRYRSIAASELARCLLALASQQARGVFIHHYDEMSKLLSGMDYH